MDLGQSARRKKGEEEKERKAGSVGFGRHHREAPCGG